MSNIWIYIIAAVLLGGGYIYALKSFSNARYDQGRADERSAVNTAHTEANNEARQDSEEIAREEKKLPDHGLDDELSRLGILRARSAR